jgi:hypothetical protein
MLQARVAHQTTRVLGRVPGHQAEFRQVQSEVPVKLAHDVPAPWGVTLRICNLEVSIPGTPQPPRKGEGHCAKTSTYSPG